MYGLIPLFLRPCPPGGQSPAPSRLSRPRAWHKVGILPKGKGLAYEKIPLIRTCPENSIQEVRGFIVWVWFGRWEEHREAKISFLINVKECRKCMSPGWNWVLDGWVTGSLQSIPSQLSCRRGTRVRTRVRTRGHPAATSHAASTRRAVLWQGSSVLSALPSSPQPCVKYGPCELGSWVHSPWAAARSSPARHPVKSIPSTSK